MIRVERMKGTSILCTRVLLGAGTQQRIKCALLGARLRGMCFRRLAKRVARRASARIGHCTAHPLARLLRTIVVHVLLILLPRLVRICAGGALFLCTQVDGAYRSNDLFRFSTR